MAVSDRPVERQVTAELLRRHDRPGPRYTSYPTALEFSADVGAGWYADKLEEADQRSHEPLSMYVHLPFCAHRCLFCGCHVIITPHVEKARPYLDLLRREIEILAARLPRRRLLSQLHLGGGTPTYHSPEELEALLKFLFTHFHLTNDAEVAVEVDPRVTRQAHVDVFARMGFNRVSLGVQDFTPKVQQAIERVQSEAETARVIERARRHGMKGINVDLIYGLPHQTLESFEQTIERTIALSVDRVAVYSFAFVPWVRGHQNKLEEQDFPTPDLKLSLFAMARERFLRAGYEPIGMDHFARPDDELARARREGRLRRNFQGYTVIPASDVIGLGISAIGDLCGSYFQNHKKLSSYEAALDAGTLPIERGVRRSKDDELRRDVIHSLMCNFAVDQKAIESRYGIDFENYFAEDLELLRAEQRDGLVEIGPGFLRATPQGELFIRNLALCFDTYFRKKHEHSKKPTFSRTV